MWAFRMRRLRVRSRAGRVFILTTHLLVSTFMHERLRSLEADGDVLGIGATSKQVTGLDGKKVWKNPLVRIGGNLSHSKGRLGRAYEEKEWEALDELKNPKST